MIKPEATNVISKPRRQSLCHWLAVAGVLLLGIVACFSMYKREYTYLNFDVLPYVEAARNLIEGKGLTTDIRSPYELKYLAMENNRVSRQNLRSLGPAFFLWLPLKVSDLSEYSVLIFSSFIFLLSLIPLYLLTRKLFNVTTGLVACVLCLCNLAMVRVGYMGFTQVPFTLFVFWSFYFLFVFSSENKWGPVAAGLLMSIAAYFREDARYLVLLGTCYLGFSKHRTNRFIQPVSFLIVYTVGILPKTIYYLASAKTTTSPTVALMLLNYIEPYGNWSATGYIDLPSVSEIICRHALDLVLRSINFAGHYLNVLVGSYTGIVLLSLYGAVVAQRERASRSFAFFVIGAVGLFFAQYSLIIPIDRYVQMPAVWLTPLAAGGLVEMARYLYRKGQSERWMYYLVLAIVLGYQFFVLVEPFARRGQQARNTGVREDFCRVFKKLDEKLPPNAYVVSDHVYEMAWYLRRPCMELPHDMATMNRLADFGVPNDYYIILGEWYYSRRQLFDPEFAKAWENKTPLNGKVFLGEFETGSYQFKLFGPGPGLIPRSDSLGGG